MGVLCFVRPSSSDFCPGRALGRCLKIAHVPQPPQRTPPLQPATRLPKQTASNTRTMVPDGKPRRPLREQATKLGAISQTSQQFPNAGAVNFGASLHHSGARVARGTSLVIDHLSLPNLGQPKTILEDHAVAMHCDALHERSLAAPQPATTVFAGGIKRSRSDIRGSPGGSGGVAAGSERDGG